MTFSLLKELKEAAQTKLPDPEVDAGVKGKILEDLALTFELDELIPLITSLGAFMKINAKDFPKGCEEVPWEVLLDPRNLDSELRDLALNLYFDRARPEKTREKSLGYIAQNHWTEVEERVWAFGVDYPARVLRMVNPQMGWEEAERYLRLHGQWLISPKKACMGPNFFPILDSSGLTLWDIIERTGEEDVVAACLSLFQNHHDRGPRGADNSPVYQELLNNWTQVLEHPSPEVRARAIALQRTWRSPRGPPKPDQRILGEAYRLEVILQDDMDPRVRASALAAVLRYHGELDWKRIRNVLRWGEPVEREAAIGALEYLVATDKIKKIDDEFFPWIDNHYRNLLKEGDSYELIGGMQIYRAFPERKKEIEILIVDFAPSTARMVQNCVTGLVLRIADWFPWEHHREVFWQSLLASNSHGQGTYARLFGYFKEEEYFKRMRKGKLGMQAISAYLAQHRVKGTLGLMLNLFQKYEYGIHRGDMGHDLVRAILNYSQEEVLENKRLSQDSKEQLVQVIKEYGPRYANERERRGGWVTP